MPSSKIRFIIPVLVIVCSLCACTSAAFAQNIHITGKVVDAVTNEPLPFINIYFPKSKAGTHTDFNGRYSITIAKYEDSIKASGLGFNTKSKALTKAPEQTFNFQLDRNTYSLEAVTVVPGENPADILMRKVIKQKNDNNKNKLDRYSMETYNKLEVDVYDINDKLKKSKLLKPMNFIFNYLDSTSEETPFLPIFISEALSDQYFRRDPKKLKEEIKANKMSGTKNESVTQFMGSVEQDVSIYDNWMGVLGKDFASPIMDNAFFYYRFYLVDSTVIDGRPCYKINFVPKEKAYNTFHGDMWIVDSAFAVKNINMQMADHVNINFVDRSSIFQEFKEVLPGTWMITKDKIVVKFKLVKKGAGLIGRKTTTYKDFKLQTEKMDSVFKDKQDITVAENALEKTDSFWEAHRHEALAAQEKGIYQMVDSLKHTKIFNTYLDIVNAILTGYYPTKYLEFGPYLSTIGLDDVEVVRLRAGFRTTTKVSTWFRVGGYVAYGFKDKVIKYGGDGFVYLMKKPRLELGGSYKHDLDLTSSGKADFGKDNILAGLWRRNVPQKLNMSDQWNAYLEKDWKFGLTVRAGFQNKKMYPQPQPGWDYHYIFGKEGFVADTFRNFKTSEFELRLRFAYKERFITNDFDRISVGTKYPVVEMRYVAGVKGIMSSQFNYHRIDFEISDKFPIHPIGTFNYDISFGKIFGTLPSQLLAVAPGNETWFFNRYSFNAMNNYEFIADQYIMVFLEHHFEGFFLNHIPGIRKLKWREVLMAKAVFGTMSDANKAMNTLNSFTVPFPKPYVEMGVGIENIFKIFRVDLVWRMDYWNNSATVKPPLVTALFGVNLNF